MKTTIVATALLSASVVAACASTPTIALTDAPALVEAHALYDDAEKGPTWLHWRHQVRVEASTRAGGATSVLHVVGAVTRYDGPTAPLTATICAPSSATPPTISAQRVDAATQKGAGVTVETRRIGRGPCLDPSQAAWTLALGDIAKGHIVEFNAVFAVPGTIAGDVQEVTAPSGRLVEGLWRYDLPDNAVGRLVTTLDGASPVAVPQAGRMVHALFARNLKRMMPTPFLRFATESVAPVGNRQDLASTWAAATAGYVDRLVTPSPTFADGYKAPFMPAGADLTERVASALAWVQARPMRADGYQAAWHTGRALPKVVAANDLTATDKTHLLAWILREAGIPFRFAMARPRAGFVALDPAFPQRDAFTTPILATTDASGAPLLLDPACENCETGLVRDGLRGGQAIVLPARDATDLMDIP